MNDFKSIVDRQLNEESDEAWIFSYADLMTLLLGFFVIMYSFSKFDEKKFDDLSRELSDTFKGDKNQSRDRMEMTVSSRDKSIITMHRMVALLNLESIDSLHRQVEDAHRSQEVKDALKKALDESQKESKDIVVQDVGGGEKAYSELILPDNILFAPGGFRIQESAKRDLQSLARKLALLDEGIKIEVIGHSDSTLPGPGGSFVDNFALSSARAGSIAQYLISSGVDRKKLSVRGMGDLDPLFPEIDRAGKPILENRAKNRRVHILIHLPQNRG